MFFSASWLLVLIPMLGIAVLAHWRVRVILRETSKFGVRSGTTGADAASAVLQTAGVNAVFVEEAPGQQLDHYSPAEKGILLRPEVYNGRTITAVAIAGHETGHAIQDATGHRFLPARTHIIMYTTFASLIGLIMLVGGFLIVESILIYFGIIVFTATVLAHLFNLVVEFDASRLGRKYLLESGVITQDEERFVRRAMLAAALSPLASTLNCFQVAYGYLVKPRLKPRQKQHAPAAVAAPEPELVGVGERPVSAAAAGGLAAAVERLRRREARA